MQEKNPINLKMSFKDYYLKLDKLQNEIRKKVIDSLEISEKTFYNRLNADGWTAIEREKIDQIIQEHLNEFTLNSSNSLSNV